ncbi:hypothetical protein [Henriciella sp.]|nr:hypothetical protein [Henriciella sp.]
MTDSQDQCDGRPVIMVYVPIFREKLAKLERAGTAIHQKLCDFAGHWRA